MSQVIRIADELYERLKSQARGFDTPSNVIERILNAYEGKESTSRKESIASIVSLDIEFDSGSEKSFKDKFINTKKAYVKLTYSTGNSEIKEWISNRFTERSSVSGNLRSGYLRDWKKKGIVKAEVAINKIEFEN